MKRLLKSPAVNAVCISIFTAFYAVVFFGISKSIEFENSLLHIEDAFFGRCGEISLLPGINFI